jgi:hypothetical protein
MQRCLWGRQGHGHDRTAGALAIAGALVSCVADGGTSAQHGAVDDAGASDGAHSELPDVILWLDEHEEVTESEWTLVPGEDGEWLVVVEGDLSLGTRAEALAEHEELVASLASSLRRSSRGVRRRRSKQRHRCECVPHGLSSSPVRRRGGGPR